MMSDYVAPDTLLPIDLTDLAKPRARKMKYLATVHDGSEHKLTNGYWCVEVYARLANKRVLPLALDVFGIDDPAVGSMNLQISRTIEKVNDSLEGKGIWIADRGFDALNLYETWFSHKCQFVVRQRGDRHVVTTSGVHIVLRDLLERMRQRWAHQGRSDAIVFCPVRLPQHRNRLYAVASWRKGQDKPLMLLTTMMVENHQQARQIIRYYEQRWVCEEATRFLKSQLSLERFHVRCYQAIQRLVALAMMAMGFLSWVLLRSKTVTGGLFCFTSRFRRKTAFIYYRLLDGLQELARLNHLRAAKIPLQSLENG
jgi:hypothetical protein